MNKGKKTLAEAEQLEQAGQIKQISSKHLEAGIKTTVLYDSVSEAAGDLERYGAIWLTLFGEDGFYQVVNDQGEPL